MFILPVVKDHLSWETTKFSGPFMQVLLYKFWLILLISLCLQDSNGLLHPDVPLKDTAALIGQAVDQLPESHPEYRRAISLVELVQALL